MDRMSEPMNVYPANTQNSQKYDQSYTYSHYYRNRKPYHLQGDSPSSQAKSNSNIRNIYANPSKINSNMQSAYSNTSKNNSFQANYPKNNNSQNSYSSPSKNIETNEDENLLLKDVYGKENSNQNNTYSFEEKDSNASTPDFSTLFQSFFQNNEKSNSTNPFQDFFSNNSSNQEMPDIEMLLKFKKIFDRINSKNGINDPFVNLLHAFKPFMQESKKSIIDQIAKFIMLSSLLQDFNSFI